MPRGTEGTLHCDFLPQKTSCNRYPSHCTAGSLFRAFFCLNSYTCYCWKISSSKNILHIPLPLFLSHFASETVLGGPAEQLGPNVTVLLLRGGGRCGGGGGRGFKLKRRFAWQQLIAAAAVFHGFQRCRGGHRGRQQLRGAGSGPRRDGRLLLLVGVPLSAGRGSHRTAGVPRRDGAGAAVAAHAAAAAAGDASGAYAFFC